MTTGAFSSLRPALQAVFDQLSLKATDAQLSSLIEYLAMLQRWNGHYNLTAVSDPMQMLTRHLADCLAVVGPLRRLVGTASARLVDVGSGGGLPGVVIAILDPQVEVTCIDAVGKKTAFVQQVAGELRLRNLHAHRGRVEQTKTLLADVVTSRAFASLPDFIALTQHHLTRTGVWMAMKGKLPADVLTALPATVDVFHVEQLAVPGLDEDRCLVWMRPIR